MTTLRMTTSFCLHQCGRSGLSGGEHCAFGRAVPSACMEEVPDMAALEVTHSAPNDLGDSVRRPEPRPPCGIAQPSSQCGANSSCRGVRRIGGPWPFDLHRRRPRAGHLVPLKGGAGCALQVSRLRLEGDVLLDRRMCASATVAVPITTVASAWDILRRIARITQTPTPLGGTS
jgi:hypothetical protein